MHRDPDDRDARVALPPVNHVLRSGSHSPSIRARSAETVARPPSARKSEFGDPWKYSRTAGSAASSRFWLLSLALRNHRLPSSSTRRTFIGRVPPVSPVAAAVQKKQFFARPTSSRILATASAPRRSARFFSGWLSLMLDVPGRPRCRWGRTAAG